MACTLSAYPSYLEKSAGLILSVVLKSVILMWIVFPLFLGSLTASTVPLPTPLKVGRVVEVRSPASIALYVPPVAANLSFLAGRSTPRLSSPYG